MIPDAEEAFVARMADLGVSWRWFVTGGALVSGSASALVQRGLVAQDEAFDQVLDVGQECGLELAPTGGRVTWSPPVAHVTGLVPRLDAVCAVIDSTVRTFRAQRPAVVVDGRVASFADVAQVAGADSLVWHLLAHVGRVPVPVTTPLAVLASREDGDPLSLVRRAHAAGTLRLATTVDSGVRTLLPARDLIAELALLGQVQRDLRRTNRLKPVVRHLETIAAELLHHLERTTVTRTDASVVTAARRVLADALAAAGLAAPVPY